MESMGLAVPVRLVSAERLLAGSLLCSLSHFLRKKKKVEKSAAPSH